MYFLGNIGIVYSRKNTEEESTAPPQGLDHSELHGILLTSRRNGSKRGCDWAGWRQIRIVFYSTWRKGDAVDFMFFGNRSNQCWYWKEDDTFSSKQKQMWTRFVNGGLEEPSMVLMISRNFQTNKCGCPLLDSWEWVLQKTSGVFCRYLHQTVYYCNTIMQSQALLVSCVLIVAFQTLLLPKS